MTEKVYLVVCEGSSDLASIQEIVRKIGSNTGKKTVAKRLMPQLDATTRKYEQAGFEGVKAWCQRMASVWGAQGRDYIGMLLALTPATSVIIHLDADIAHLLRVNDRSFEGAIGDRRRWCEAAIEDWMVSQALREHAYFLIPTWQIETWILATYDSELFEAKGFPHISDYESVTDVEGRLLRLGYDEDEEKPGRMYKEHQLYSHDPRYLPRIVADLPTAASRASELQRF